MSNIRSASLSAVAPTPIPQIQGRGGLSPYDGQTVSTSGIITAVRTEGSNKGFFLQDPTGDGDVNTSDAVFIATDKVADPKFASQFVPGQKMEITGRVADEGFTTIVAEPKGFKKVGRALAPDKLPTPVELKLPAAKNQSLLYLEAREGMLSSLPNAMVIGPTSKYRATIYVDEKAHGPVRDFDDKRAGQRLVVSGALGHNPQLVTGDRVGDIFGPLSYDTRMSKYELLQARRPGDVARGPLPPRMWGDIDGNDQITADDLSSIKARLGEAATGPTDPADLNADGKITRTDINQASKRIIKNPGVPTFTVASMNVENLFDRIDNPDKDDQRPSVSDLSSHMTRISSAIRDQLKLPDVITVAEAENESILQELAKRPEIKSAGYKVKLLEGPDRRGINVGLLYRGDSVTVNDVRQANKMIDENKGSKGGLVDGDADSQPSEQKPLFARPPLIADLTVKKGGQSQDFTIIANHLMSKFSPLGLPTDPTRVLQTKFLGSLVDDLQKANPGRGIVVMGDMNDTEKSRAMKALEGPKSNKRLVNLGATQVPRGERYTYSFEGRSELIDHIFTTPQLAKQVQTAGIRHFNADIPYSARWNTMPFGSSDHDVPYATFQLNKPVDPAKPLQAAVAATRGALAAQPKTASLKAPAVRAR